MSDDEGSDDERTERMEAAKEHMEVTELEWFTTHYEVLEELFGMFRDSGEDTFGSWFFQNGGFHHFVHFVYAYSVLSSNP
jgi:hypothetical protein